MMEIYILPFVFIFLIVLIVGICLSLSSKQPYEHRKRDVKIQFLETEGDRPRYVGHGYSVGGAAVDGFRKLHDALTPNSHLDTMKRNLDCMVKTLAQYRDQMRESDISSCQFYIDQTRKMYDAKANAKEAAALKEANEQKEKDKAASMRQKFIAEQRRLMSDSLRYDVMQRDHFRCQLCGATQADGVKLHVDHIKPVSRGGKTEMSNLRTLCERCNLGKGSKIEDPIPMPIRNSHSNNVATPVSVSAEKISPSVNTVSSTSISNTAQSTPASESNKSSCFKPRYDSAEDFIRDAKRCGLIVVDKRSNGGCIWISSSPKADEALSEVWICNKFPVKASRTRAFNNAPGWFLKLD